MKSSRPHKLYFGEENHSYRPALQRFAEKCRFDPFSGCVLWTGGTTAGRGNSARYGSFWFQGSRWYSHRWSAVHIHGLDLGENQAGHCCPHGVNSLCVEHVTAQTQLENLNEQNTRMKAKATQSAAERQFYLFVQLGIEPAPMMASPACGEVPFYSPPRWLRPFLPKENSDEPPF
jgi:hypothetical protein